MSVRTDLLSWLVVVEACALAVLPLTLRIFGRLPDRGYGLGKALGLLLVTYLLWLPGMLGFIEYRRVTVLLVLLLAAAFCWWRWGEETVVWLRTSHWLIGLEEATFLGAGA